MLRHLRRWLHRPRRCHKRPPLRHLRHYWLWHLRHHRRQRWCVRWKMVLRSSRHLRHLRRRLQARRIKSIPKMHPPVICPIWASIRVDHWWLRKHSMCAHQTSHTSMAVVEDLVIVCTLQRSKIRVHGVVRIVELAHPLAQRVTSSARIFRSRTPFPWRAFPMYFPFRIYYLLFFLCII